MNSTLSWYRTSLKTLGDELVAQDMQLAQKNMLYKLQPTQTMVTRLVMRLLNDNTFVDIPCGNIFCCLYRYIY